MEETLYRWRKVEGICGGRYGRKCANLRGENMKKCYVLVSDYLTKQQF